MKKITLTALSVAIALGLAACGKAPETTSTETAKPAAEQQATAAVAALVSGVDKENFDSAVRFAGSIKLKSQRKSRRTVLSMY
jgi:putative endopeptidase